MTPFQPLVLVFIFLLHFICGISKGTVSTKRYDVCVIGGGIGGLVSSSKLALEGKKVIILEKNKLCGGRLNSERLLVSKASYRFDVGPSLLLLPNVYAETFELLNESISKHIDLIEVNPFYRCYFEEDSTFSDITSKEDYMRDSLEKIEKDSWGKFQDYMNIARHFLRFGLPNVIEEKLDLSSLGDFIAACIKSFPLITHMTMLNSRFSTNKMRAMMSFQDLYIGLSPYEAPSIFALLQALELDRGIFYPRGGFEQVTRAFESIAHKNGVQIECNACVTSLNLQALSSEPAITSVASSHRRISSATVARSAAVPREVSASDASFHCSSQADRQLYAPGSSKGGEEKKDRDEDGMEVGVDVMTRDVKSTLDEAQADVFVINIDAPEAERSLIAKIVPGISRESVTADSDASAYKQSCDNDDIDNEFVDQRTANGRPSCGIVSLHFALDREIPGLTHHTLFLSSRYKDSWKVVEDPDWRGEATVKVLQASWAQQGGLGGPGRSEVKTELPTANSYAGFNPDAFNFYVHAPSRTDQSACPLGHDAITVLVPVTPLPKVVEKKGRDSSGSSFSFPQSPVDFSYDIELIRKSVLRRLQLAVDLCDSDGSYGAIANHIVGERVRTPTEWNSEFNLFRGGAFGLAHSLDQLSVLRPRIRHPKIKNLYRVGASTRPGNGVPLVMIGARLTSEAVLSDMAALGP